MSRGIDEAGKTQHHWIPTKENKSTDPSGTANARHCHAGFQVSTIILARTCGCFCLGTSDTLSSVSYLFFRLESWHHCFSPPLRKMAIFKN